MEGNSLRFANQTLSERDSASHIVQVGHFLSLWYLFINSVSLFFIRNYGELLRTIADNSEQ